MPLDEVMQGVAVCEPAAYPVFTALLKAYPKNHFTGVIQEIMMGGTGGVIDGNSLNKILEEADKR
jgi:hypothetical protein